MYENANGMSLRKIERSDLPALLELKGESWPFTHRSSVLSMEDQEWWFDHMSGDPHTPPDLYMMGVTGGVTVGIFKLLPIDWQNRRAGVGWDVFREHRGHGHGKRLAVAGTEFARDVLQLHRLWAEILETNVPSQRCAEAAGFKKEGVEKAAILKKGRYVDSILYGIVFDTIE